MVENPGLPVVITAKQVEVKITQSLAANKVTVSDLLKKEQTLVDNEDYLLAMKEVFEMCDKIEELAAATHKEGKSPHLEGGRSWDGGKKLVCDQTEWIRAKWWPKYQARLKGIALRGAAASEKVEKEVEIRKKLEDSIMIFSQKIISASTLEDLRAVESLINLQKTPQAAAKYAEFHGFYIEMIDSVLLPIIKTQKEKVKEIRGLNAELKAAEEANDASKWEATEARINELSNMILQNQAVIGDAALRMAPLPVIEAQEVLPPIKVNRTTWYAELVDVELAFKKSRHLLDITFNKEAIKAELKKMKADGKFRPKDDDEIIIDGIKFIQTVEREAL